MAPGATLHLILVRHAEHDRVGTILCGRMDGVSLSEAGRRQARALAGRLGARGLDALYTSPLDRTAETAREIGRDTGHTPIASEAFNEIDFGEWTGRAFAELGDDERWRVWNESRATARAAGGETMADVKERTRREMAAMRGRHPGGRVAIVSHCDVIKTVVCDVLGLSLDRVMSFDVDPASTSEIVAWDGGAKLIRLNEPVAS